MGLPELATLPPLPMLPELANVSGVNVSGANVSGANATEVANSSLEDDSEEKFLLLDKGKWHPSVPAGGKNSEWLVDATCLGMVAAVAYGLLRATRARDDVGVEP